jgi:hypothetical protein
MGRTISGKGVGRAGTGRRAGKALLEDRIRSYRLFGSRSRWLHTPEYPILNHFVYSDVIVP